MQKKEARWTGQGGTPTAAAASAAHVPYARCCAIGTKGAFGGLAKGPEAGAWLVALFSIEGKKNCPAATAVGRAVNPLVTGHYYSTQTERVRKLTWESGGLLLKRASRLSARWRLALTDYQ